MRCVAVAILVGCGGARPTVAPHGIRVEALLSRPLPASESVTVDIYEPLEQRAGAFEVDTGDGSSMVIVAPAKTDAERAAGGMERLPDVLEPPIEIRGTLRRVDGGWRLIPHTIEPLRRPRAEHVAATSALIDNPARWNGAIVDVEGVWLLSFEISQLDDIWLDVPRTAKVRCAPPESTGEEEPPARVRVVGLAQTGGQFGHLGAAKARIVASEVVYLDRGCK